MLRQSPSTLAAWHRRFRPRFFCLLFQALRPSLGPANPDQSLKAQRCSTSGAFPDPANPLPSLLSVAPQKAHSRLSEPPTPAGLFLALVLHPSSLSRCREWEEGSLVILSARAGFVGTRGPGTTCAAIPARHRGPRGSNSCILHLGVGVQPLARRALESAVWVDPSNSRP